MQAVVDRRFVTVEIVQHPDVGEDIGKNERGQPEPPRNTRFDDQSRTEMNGVWSPPQATSRRTINRQDAESDR